MTRLAAGLEKNTPLLYRELLATADEVQERIDTIATAAIDRYKSTNPLFVCLLRGGAPFATRLMTSIAEQDPYFHPEMDYMTVSVYRDEKSAGEPQLVMGLAPHTKIAGRQVVMLDDALDKGVTAAFTERYLRDQGAAAVDFLVLVQRNCERQAYGSATIAGFEVDSEAWLTGMGLDDSALGKEANRWAGFIAIAS